MCPRLVIHGLRFGGALIAARGVRLLPRICLKIHDDASRPKQEKASGTQLADPFTAVPPMVQLVPIEKHLGYPIC